MKLPEFLTEWPYGEIVLTGHRIGLFHVVREHRKGRSPEEIVEQFPSLELELVRKVITFYGENRAEVDAYVDAYQAELDRQEAAYVPSPEALRLKRLAEKLRHADATHGSDPAWTSLSLPEKIRRIEDPAQGITS